MDKEKEELLKQFCKWIIDNRQDWNGQIKSDVKNLLDLSKSAEQFLYSLMAYFNFVST